MNRRRFLKAVEAVGAGTVLAGCNESANDKSEDLRDEACGGYEPTVEGTSDWRTVGGDAAGTGVVPATDAPEPPLTVDWMSPIDAPRTIDRTVPIDGVSGTTRPTVTPTRVFTHDMDTTVCAMDSETGDSVWSRAIDDPRGSPAVGDDVLVLIRDGEVVTLNAENGETLWTGPGGHAGRFFRASPIIHDSVAYVPLGLSLFTLDLADGTVRWKHTTGHETSGTPARVGDTVFYGDTDTYLHALDAATGEERWGFKTGGPIRSNVSIVDDTVFLATTAGTAYGIDRETGTRRWKQSVDGAIRVVASDGARVYIGTAKRLHALQASDGTECWSTGAYLGAHDSGLAVGDGRVYVPKTGDRDVLADVQILNAATGKQQWATDLLESERETNLRSGPIVADGAVYGAGSSSAGLTLFRFS